MGGSTGGSMADWIEDVDNDSITGVFTYVFFWGDVFISDGFEGDLLLLNRYINNIIPLIINILVTIIIIYIVFILYIIYYI